jgi:hypothetical protein
MECSTVGYEIWGLFAMSAFAVIIMVFRTRELQAFLLHISRWRAQPYSPRGLADESRVWSLRLLALLPFLVWLGTVFGVYCFFHGPDVPPVNR